jgi:uncharacterized repeat protein (TIGR03803 family)
MKREGAWVGSNERARHSRRKQWSGCADGANPGASLIQGTGGNFYGTTTNGGTYNEGTVFQMTPVGRLTTLHSFCAPSAPSCTDGDYPNASLLQATSGEFYGTDTGGGYSSSSGTVFSLIWASVRLSEPSRPQAARATSSQSWGPISPAQPASHSTARRLLPSGFEV